MNFNRINNDDSFRSQASGRLVLKMQISTSIFTLRLLSATKILSLAELFTKWKWMLLSNQQRLPWKACFEFVLKLNKFFITCCLLAPSEISNSGLGTGKLKLPSCKWNWWLNCRTQWLEVQSSTLMSSEMECYSRCGRSNGAAGIHTILWPQPSIWRPCIIISMTNHWRRKCIDSCPTYLR